MANLYVEQFNANLKHYQGNFPLALERLIDLYLHEKLFLSKTIKDALLNLKAYLADIRLPNGDFKKPLGQILVQYNFIKPEKSPKRFSFGGLFKSEKPEFPFWAIKKRPENRLAMYSQKKSRLKKLRQKTKKYVLMPKDFMEVFQCAIQIEKSIRQAEANIAKARSKKSISAGLLFKVEVALAREDFSLHAIRSQILGLEKTLEMKSNMTSNDYLKINNNIKNWALVFGEKDREFVFDAPNLDILKKRLEKGPLPTTEHILTYIDKRYGWHSPSYASTARWHDWKMECETWAQPLQFIQPGHTDSRIMAPERAEEAYFIRTDRSVMPASAIVRLPSKRCLDRPFKVSGLEMSLTHTNGAPVQWTSVELVMPNSIPFAGLRSTKPALGRYHCFPLGKRTSFGYKAYDLKPGTYTMSIHYRANPVAAPVLIDQVPFGVSGN